MDLDFPLGLDSAVIDTISGDNIFTHAQRFVDYQPFSDVLVAARTEVSIVPFVVAPPLPPPPVNAAPTGVVLSGSQTVEENTAAGNVIGTLIAEDPDLGDAHTFRLLPGLSGPGAGDFEVFGNMLRVASGAEIDFEAQSSYSLAIEARDGDGSTVVQTVTVAVENVPISSIGIVSGGAVAEDAPAGTAVIQLEVFEGLEVEPTAVLSLTDAANGRFELDGDTVRVRSGANLDFETDMSHLISIAAQEGTGLSIERSFNITIIDIDETMPPDPSTNSPPLATDDLGSVILGQIVLINVIENDFDPDGDTILLADVLAPVSGSVEVRPDGRVAYTAPSSGPEADSFDYQIEDGRGGLDTGTVTLRLLSDQDIGLGLNQTEARTVVACVP